MKSVDASMMARAIELASRRITVNCVNPGTADTPSEGAAAASASTADTASATPAAPGLSVSMRPPSRRHNACTAGGLAVLSQF